MPQLHTVAKRNKSLLRVQEDACLIAIQLLDADDDDASTSNYCIGCGTQNRTFDVSRALSLFFRTIRSLHVAVFATITALYTYGRYAIFC